MVEITQAHVDHAMRIAWSLGETTAGKVAGADELESQALVVLWDLARAWDPELGTTSFHQYLKVMGRRRLIDWLRHELGKAGTSTYHARAATVSLDGMPTSSGGESVEPSPEPGPERVALARRELDEALACIRAVLTPRQRTVLIAKAVDGDVTAVAAHLGMSPATAHTHASQARKRVRAALADPQAIPAQRTPRRRT